MTDMLDRRAFLARSGAVLGAAAAAAALPARSAFAAALKPAERRFKAIDFASTRPALLQWPSEKAVREHFKLYEGYVKKANEILEALEKLDAPASAANATYSAVRELKLELSFAIGGVKNHEIYFGHLGGKGGKPGGALASALVAHFGSYDAWVADLKATGIASRGWTWLAYDLDRRTLFNYLGDAQNSFPIWNAVPLLALDVYEHAYFMDYGTRRADYVDAFLAHLDWDVIERTYDRAVRLASV